MNTKTIDYIFDEITLLPESDRDRLFLRMKDVYYSYSDNKTVAYTTSGRPLTKEQYRKRVEKGILQCKEGKYTELEQLSEKLGYNYADL